MTTEMDALPEGVREAVAAIDNGNGVFVDSDDGVGGEKWQIVRAELIRLTARVQELLEIDRQRCEEYNTLVVDRANHVERAEKAESRVRELERENGLLVRGHKVALSAWRDAEAELAAVKKRIAEAETFVVHRHPAGAVMATYMCNSKLDGKRVALLPLDDEAKS